MHQIWCYLKSPGGHFECFLGRKFDLALSRATLRVSSASPSIPMMRYDSSTCIQSSKGARKLSQNTLFYWLMTLKVNDPNNVPIRKNSAVWVCFQKPMKIEVSENSMIQGVVCSQVVNKVCTY